MRRVGSVLIVAVMLCGMAIFTGRVGVAQDATPPTGEMGFPESIKLAPGVVADSMVFLEGQENPSLYRLHFDAGVVYPVAPSPNLEVVYMEAGSLTVTLDGAVTVGQVGEAQAEGESIPSNTEFALEQGQFVVLQPGVSGEVRNDGEQTATVSVAGLTPAGVSVPEATPAG